MILLRVSSEPLLKAFAVHIRNLSSDISIVFQILLVNLHDAHHCS